MKQIIKWLCLVTALTLVATASGCRKSKTQEDESSSMFSSDYVSADSSESEQTDSSSESEVSSQTGAGTQTSSSNASTGQVLVANVKGDNIPAASRVLPDMKPEGKTVKILTHGGEFDHIENITSKYGIKLEYIKVVNTEKNQKLASMVAAGNSPDLFCSCFFPTLVVRNYVQDLSKYIDFNSDVWKGIKPMLDNFKWSNKYYYTVTRYGVDGVVWYNKSIFEEAGLTDPLTLYNQGKWDWNAYKDYAAKLTVDANKDGTPEQYGHGTCAMELVNNTTGKGFISYVVNGLPTNNLKSAEIARAIKFNMDLRNAGYLAPDGQNNFAAGKVALYWGYIWEREPFSKMLKTGSLGMAPSPRDPSADKYYFYTGAEGYFIPRGAKNPTGAAALITGLRINSFDDTRIKERLNDLIAKGVWTKEFDDTINRMKENENLVGDPWATFGLGDYFGDFYTRAATEAWSKIAEEISPKIDANIKKMYSTNK